MHFRLPLRPMGPATAGSVFGTSASFEFTDFFAGFKDWDGRCLLGGGEFSVDDLYFRFEPAATADFNLAVLPDQKQTGHIGQAVCIRDSVACRIVEQCAKGNAVLLQKGSGLFFIVL